MGIYIYMYIYIYIYILMYINICAYTYSGVAFVTHLLTLHRGFLCDGLEFVDDSVDPYAWTVTEGGGGGGGCQFCRIGVHWDVSAGEVRFSCNGNYMCTCSICVCKYIHVVFTQQYVPVCLNCVFKYIRVMLIQRYILYTYISFVHMYTHTYLICAFTYVYLYMHIHMYTYTNLFIYISRYLLEKYIPAHSIQNVHTECAHSIQFAHFRTCTFYSVRTF